ncbi:MAG: oligopeptide/dipeptide ABC transporter ATP-binding protein [Clostridiales bacterium]
MKDLIYTEGLKKYFKTPGGLLHAVDDINLSIPAGQTLGVVGESGCGKSTLGRTMIRLIDSTEGKVFFDGEDINTFDKKQLKNFRKNAQMIFQDPYSSINPRMSVSQIIAEPMKVCKTEANKKARDDKVKEIMNTVGLALRFYNAYPHELDGGRRQRIGVARALALDPKFVVCDEPVSALDVSIQAQILNLLMDLQETNNLSYMFITHDLSVVKHISHSIMVMYLGECIEQADTDELYENPLHPYTKALLSAIPIPELRRQKRAEVIRGEVKSPVNPAPGCRFAPRCPHARPECVGEKINEVQITPTHKVACVLYY